MVDQKERNTGIVRAFDPFKGFGFIRRKSGKDVFFFYSDITAEDKDINIGDTVSFTLQAMPKGPRAFDIEVLSTI